MKRTQKGRIECWLKQGLTITPLEALGEFGCFRLSAVIFDLRKEGRNIETKMVEVSTRNGHATVAEYKLID